MQNKKKYTNEPIEKYEIKKHNRRKVIKKKKIDKNLIGILLCTLCLLSIIIPLTIVEIKISENEKELMTYTYQIEEDVKNNKKEIIIKQNIDDYTINSNNIIYKLKDLFVLYKKNERKLCIRKKIKTDKIKGARVQLIGFIPMTLPTTTTEYRFDFVDINNNKIIASTKYSKNRNDDGSLWLDKENSLNGYKYNRLIQILSESKNKEINNEVIENKINNYTKKLTKNE